MRCVILGGRGFLGRHVGRAMAAAGHEVWSVDQGDALPDDSLPWLAGDVVASYADVDSWVSVVGEPQVLVHLASSTVPATASENPIEDAEVNLIATLRLLHGLRDLPARPRLLFASSGGAVYGRPLSVPISERHATEPLGAYGVTKLALEHHLRVEGVLNGLSYRVLRLSNPFGEWQRPQGAQGVVTVFANRALRREPIEVWGDGTVVRDFLYAGDVGAAFAAAAVHEGEARVFNIGGGVGVSVNEIIGALEGLLGYSVERRNLPGRPFDPPVNVLDTSLARRELEWEPKVGFQEGLNRLVHWLRSIQ